MSLTMISVTSCSVESTYLLMAVHLTDSMPMVSGTIETDPACAALAFERPHSATLPNAGRQAPLEAAARDERRLEAVACTPMFGLVLGRDSGSAPLIPQPLIL